MTRATLGHTGQALSADAGTVAIYLLLILAVRVRFSSGPLTELTPALLTGAFGGFSALYGRRLLRARPER